MKNVFKKASLYAVVICAAGVSASLLRAESGNVRIDYLNDKGERTASIYGKDGAGLFNVSGNNSAGFEISGNYGSVSNPRSIKIIPWGVESYPVTVEQSTPDIKVSIATVDEGGDMSEVRSARTRSDEPLVLKCGTKIRISIEMPEGNYPVLRSYLHYTNLGEGEDRRLGAEAHALTMSDFTGSGSMTNGYITSAQRKSLIDYLQGTGAFMRSATGSDVWTIDYVMPNEPISLEIAMEKPDAQILRALVYERMRQLYNGYRSSFIQAGFDNGEPFISYFAGEFNSEDLISGYSTVYDGYNVHATMGIMDAKKIVTAALWGDCFGWITEANAVLSLLDRFTDVPEEDMNFARAQMLVLRSHAYWRILQLYGYRWQDSRDGEALCAPLETELKEEDMPLSSMKEIRDRCYADLDMAAMLLPSTARKGQDIIFADANVAKGVKMRIALLCEDWNHVRSLGEDILNSNVFRMTTNEEMTSGFFTPAGSWMWGAWNNDSNGIRLGYTSFQSLNACNGSYPGGWRMGCNAISKDLYMSIPEGDVRRSLYAMPDQMPADGSYGYNSWDWWYTPNMVTPQTLQAYYEIDNNGTIMNYAPYLFANAYLNKSPEGVVYGAFQGMGGGLVPVQFGSQVKFFQPGATQFDDAAVVFMRIEEIMLSVAEAMANTGNAQSANQILNQLGAARNPGQAPAFYSGDQLLDEIIRARKIELWGEGHSWFDQKRRNLPIVRRVWTEGDTQSGNWPTSLAGDFDISRSNRWRYMIPAYYVKDNSRIDVSLLGYDDISAYAPATQSTRKTTGIGIERSTGKRFDIMELQQSPLTTVED